MYKDIRCDEQLCGNLKVSLEKEWLETNGLGGYASSTIVGVHTRRYHGLLVAGNAENTKRTLYLSKCEERVIVGGDTSYYLSCNIYPNAIHPTGFMHLKEWSLDPFPTFVYHIEDEMSIAKQIFMVHGSNTVVVRYTMIEGAGEIELKVRPLCTYRSHHDILRKNDAINTIYQVREGGVHYQPHDEAEELILYHNGYLIEGTGLWYYQLNYLKDRDRGYEYTEDLFNPYEINFVLSPEKEAYFIATLDPACSTDVKQLEKQERRYREAQILSYVSHHALPQQPTVYSVGYRYLLHAADSFIVKRGSESYAIIAGYPWFGEWGRDSLISLPGLTLATGKTDVARAILLRYSAMLSCGKMPNCIDEETNEPLYTAVDTGLWFSYAVYKYLAYTGDYFFVVESLLDTMQRMVSSLIKGEDPSFYMDADGLLTVSPQYAQGTWMDAQMGALVVTPRIGKIVEVNALWFLTVSLLGLICRHCQEHEVAEHYEQLARKIKQSFTKVFWNEETGCLYDFVTPTEKNAIVRPNQIYAVSVPFGLCELKHELRIVEHVERVLLTMYGLRTLSPDDPRYNGYYVGDRYSRDAAYHQGTVWPWLIGPFIDAYMKVNGRKGSGKDICESLMKALFHHVLHEGGLGYISEACDGNFPHVFRGCIAQAWSVAEVVRVYHEYVIAEKPAVLTVKS